MAPHRPHFWSILEAIFNKNVPTHWQTAPYDHGPGLPDSPPRVRAFWTRNNYLSKKQEQLLISESISEPFSRNGLFFDFMSEEMFMFWWNLKQKRQVIANVFLLLFLSKGWWSDMLWAKARRIAEVSFLIVSFQRQMIWHALGQGPANFFENRVQGASC